MPVGGRLRGRIAVVMGAGEPAAGRSAAVQLAIEGARVVAVDPSAEALDATCTEIRKSGGKVAELVASIDEEDSIAAVVAQCADEFGIVDVLVNAHFLATRCSIEESSAAQWSDALRVNTMGPVLCSKAFLPLLKRSHSASIVHIGSVDGMLGNPTVPTYSVSKGALVPLTHVMADEFAKYSIRVNCVARAAIDDGRPGGAAIIDRLLQQTPLGRAAAPAEVGRVVAFFASDDSSYCTGAVLPVDGGRTGITPGTRP